MFYDAASFSHQLLLCVLVCVLLESDLLCVSATRRMCFIVYVDVKELRRKGLVEEKTYNNLLERYAESEIHNHYYSVGMKSMLFLYLCACEWYFFSYCQLA